MEGRIQKERENRISIIGKIKIGEQSENGIPRSLDYFRATGQYAELFHKTFGDQPQKLEVVFLSDDIHEVCFERYEIRQGSKLFAFGDGQVFRVWSKEHGQYEDFTIEKYPQIMDMIKKKAGEKAEWYQILTLRFIILRLRGVFGGWQFDTRAVATTIPQIVAVFDTVRETAGTIINIPFDLIVEKVKSQKPDSKNSFPIVKLIPNVSLPNLELIKDMRDAGKQITGILTDEKLGIKLVEYNNIETGERHD
jgi:hypothetical protein